MKIEIRSIDGVQESEKAALSEMQKAFSRDWLGYAAFEMLQRGGNYEVDLVLITHERIIVVELKRWTGDIRSDGESWYCRDQFMERSPVKKTQLKSKVLASILKKQLGDQPFVDARVVLCGRTDSLTLIDDEKPYVRSLEEFLRIADPKHYAREFPQRGSKKPLDHSQKYRSFFMGNAFKPKAFAFQNFVQDGTAIFEHPRSVYKEYRAQNRDDPNATALMRRWNFATLGLAAGTQKDRALVATREQRVLNYVANRDDDAATMFITPISSSAVTDVTSDHCELFRLPSKHARLSAFVSRFEGKLSLEQRLDLIRTVLSRFSVLHKLGVAHRDIGAHSLWIERPVSVLLSGFVAAHFPETETVGGLREHVQAGDVLLPDDAMQDDKATPYSRDVFLLGVAAHSLLFGRPPAKEHDLHTWAAQPSDIDPVGGRLDAWFQQSLSWTASDRFATATEMLHALNAIDLGLVRAQVVDLAWFEPFRNARRFERDFPDTVRLSDLESPELYRSETGQGQFVVKIWWNVRPDEKRPEESLRLLRFLQAANHVRQSPLPCLSRIIDFGLSPKGAVYLVREWTSGLTLREWLVSTPTTEARRALALDLVTAIARLHELSITHGDLNPTNIICRSGDAGGVVLIDVPDLQIGDVGAHSTAYAPPNWEKLPVDQRDRYGVVLIVREILSEDVLSTHAELRGEIDRVADMAGAISLEPLLESLGSLFKENASKSSSRIAVSLRYSSTVGALLSDNGEYHVSVDSKQANERVAIALTGVRARLRLIVEPGTFKLHKAYLSPVSHQQFLDATRRAAFKFSGSLEIESGPIDDAAELIEALRCSIEPQAVTSVAVSRPGEETHPDGVNVRKIWSTLIRAEAEALMTVTVAADPYLLPGREGVIFVPYRQEGNAFDFDDADDVDVLDDERLQDGERRRIGSLVLRETTSSVMAVSPRWSSWSPKLGETLRVRSKATYRSYEKRKRAVDRVLSGRAIIPDLIRQFEPSDSAPVLATGRTPTDAELDTYNIIEGDRLVFSLNEDQRSAFKKLAANGPVGLLQGPPGTGKTAFIASFVHFLLSRCGVRRILLVSQSHEAVNNALEKALELATRTRLQVDAVRIGQEAMLAESVALHHPNAIQQQYRERFSAQILERLGALAPPLGLPGAFVREFSELHLDLGRLVLDIARLAEQVVAEPDDVEELAKRLTSRRETYWDIVENKYGLARSESISDAFNTLEAEIATHHGIQSPDSINRLRQAIGLSREWLEVLGSRTGNFVEFLTRTRAIVAGTCVGVGQWQAQVAQHIYDWVIIDEAGRATPPELAVPMQVGRRILLVGDHQQLPPFFDDGLKSQLQESVRDEAGLKNFLMSDFERIFETAYARGRAAALQTQYRMAPSIGSMVSNCFYPTRELIPGRGPAPDWYKTLPAPLDREVIWLDTSHLEKAGRESRSDDETRTWNEAEAKVVLAAIRAIVGSHAFYSQLKLTLKEGEPAIGVICMYSEQCRVVERALAQADWVGSRRRDIKVDTVDSYQGKENRIVIVSLVRDNPGRKEGFLDKPYRTNVAMSRAMDRLIVVGAASMWRGRHTPLGKVVTFIEENRNTLSVDLIDSIALTAMEVSHEA